MQKCSSQVYLMKSLLTFIFSPTKWFPLSPSKYQDEGGGGSLILIDIEHIPHMEDIPYIRKCEIFIKTSSRVSDSFPL